ncbi:MAG: hypothetical protein EA417_12005 [Gammaproteobacteria bacterium]|nr:MAG: hypothetical protein EA417_12005 [Gammaproteobacteria bacterium]
MVMEITGESQGLVINVPEWFQEPDFLAWLNNPTTSLMTWHTRGEPANEYSDTIVFVDPGLSGEGPDADMPAKYWGQILEACRSRFRPWQTDDLLVVRITNLGG